MKDIPKISVGISTGDPNGIGIEIILKAFEDKRLFSFITPVVFAHTQSLAEEAKRLGFTTDFFTLNNINSPKQGRINVVDTWTKPFSFHHGKLDTAAGEAALSSLQAATLALKKAQVKALVTAPIHKKNIQNPSFNFPGHTDYLSKELEGESLMFMVTEGLKIALVTDHVPLREITQKLSKERITKKIEMLSKSLTQDFGIQRPKIAVLAINPHAGDEGVIGTEDDTLLRPLLKSLFEKGEMVFGPFAADGFFGSQSYTKYDAVLAMYHDQGLIPFKTLSFGKGVNFTAGLTQVRTSPDHGTAFDIAGQGIADASSFKEALFTARSIYLKRKDFEKEIVNQRSK